MKVFCKNKEEYNELAILCKGLKEYKMPNVSMDESINGVDLKNGHVEFFKNKTVDIKFFDEAKTLLINRKEEYYKSAKSLIENKGSCDGQDECDDCPIDVDNCGGDFSHWEGQDAESVRQAEEWLTNYGKVNVRKDDITLEEFDSLVNGVGFWCDSEESWKKVIDYVQNRTNYISIDPEITLSIYSNFKIENRMLKRCFSQDDWSNLLLDYNDFICMNLIDEKQEKEPNEKPKEDTNKKGVRFVDKIIKDFELHEIMMTSELECRDENENILCEYTDVDYYVMNKEEFSQKQMALIIEFYNKLERIV